MATDCKTAKLGYTVRTGSEVCTAACLVNNQLLSMVNPALLLHIVSILWMRGAISQLPREPSQPGTSSSRWTTTFTTARAFLMISTAIRRRAVQASDTVRRRYAYFYHSTRWHVPGDIFPVPLSKRNSKFWRFKSSDMWRCVVVWVVPDVSKHLVAFILQGKQLKKNTHAGTGGVCWSHPNPQSTCVFLWLPLKFYVLNLIVCPFTTGARKIAQSDC
jgi:hypothetical protein